MSKKIIVQNISVGLMTHKGDDYISLTDIARYKNKTETGLVISHWLSTRFCVEFMGIWEQIYNNNFNTTEFSKIKSQSGANGFVLSVIQWVKRTGAIGIFARPGRYASGTYAHRDIALEFASWISPEFKLYLIKEFQRLKIEENERLVLGWDMKRLLAKVNYKIHTDAIKEHIIPQKISKEMIEGIYATEADVLNVALFGITAKEWRTQNPKKEGNIRDYSEVEQLIVLSNLESLNAEFIRQNIPQSVRLVKLNEIAIGQMKSLINNSSIKKLRESVGVKSLK